MKNKGLLTILLLFGFLFSIFFLFVLLVVAGAGGDMQVTGEGFGVVEVLGPIMDGKEAVEQLEEFERNDNIKGIIVRVDSPGGAVAPSQEIYRAVLRAREKKKVVISMGSTAASGGYYIACAGDRIFANPGTVTGSIGVITQFTNFEELLDVAPVDVNTVTSGEYKDTGNPFRKFTEDDRAFFKQLVMNIYDQFVRDIAAARKMDEEEVRALADGRVYTGEQAKENGLVDELGGLREASEYLAKEVGIKDDKIELIYPPSDDEELFRKLLQGATQGATQGFIQGTRGAAAPRIEYRYLGPQ